MASQVPDSLYKSFFDNAFDGLAYCQMIFDAEGRPIDFVYEKVNKNFEKLTGLQNVEGKKITELAPGITVSNPELFEIYGRVSLTGESQRFEVYVEPLSRWFLISAYCPKKNFFVAVFQNITARKLMAEDLQNAKVAARNVLEDLQVEKEALDREKAKDEALLESIGEGVVAVDQEGRVIIMSKVAKNLLAFADRELNGKFFVQAVALEDAQGNQILGAQHPIILALTVGKTTVTTTTTSTTYNFVRKDGTKFPAAITVTPVLFDDKPTGAIIVFRDITKEQAFERAKSEFISIASHQLRTPLTGIQWVAERFMENEELTPQGKGYLKDIHVSATRLMELMDLMLSLSRMEAGKVEIAPEPTEVIEFVKNYLQEIAGLCDEKQLQVVFGDHPSKLPAKTDKSALRNIIQNILSNAIDYTPAKGKILISLQKKDTTFVITIQDTGIGIPKAEQHQIFEKFARANNAKLYKTDGTGIGLYIAKRSANLLGGEIWFESAENKGSTFYVELPLECNPENARKV